MSRYLPSWLSSKNQNSSSTVAGAASNPSQGLVRTPHAPYHYSDQDSTDSKRCFEGWYLKLTLPDHRSVAFIHCVEDPAGNSPFSKVTSQVVWGPGGSAVSPSEARNAENGGKLANLGQLRADPNFPKEGFMMQHGRNVSNFWGSTEAMEFGATYTNQPGHTPAKSLLENEQAFFKNVHTGFQASEKLHCGALEASAPDGDMTNRILDETETILISNTASQVKWCYKMDPIHGWGAPVVINPQAAAAGDTSAQHDVRPPEKNGNKATTGWLALSPAFDPQWQICTAHAAASGWIEIDGHRIEFSNAPAYVEKNWGGGFPRQWFWLQCNAFPGAHPDLTVTAVGAHRRSIQTPGAPYVDVGIIGVHFQDEFIECLPWNAKMEWEVQPWGSWRMSGSSAKFDVEIDATTADKEEKGGTWLYGPHETAGFIPYCRDAFSGRLRMKIWRRKGNGAVSKAVAAAASVLTGDESKEERELVLDVESYDAAVECGGGPWDGVWKSECAVPKLISDTVLGPVAQLKSWAQDQLSS